MSTEASDGKAGRSPLRPEQPWAPVLRPGQTCYALGRAGRTAVIVDAADYFLAVEGALLRARHQVLFIAWDFDTRIKLAPARKRKGREADVPPRRLGPFLTWLARRTPTLHIHVLKWRLSLFQAAWRGMTPLFVLNWLSDSRLHYRLAADHPIGACHHQKIVVIDDSLAFCGGIDMTADRWDTRDHLDHDPRRRRPGGRRYDPFHDTTMAVDGDAARILGEIARQRWASATGESLDAPPEKHDIWPDGLTTLARSVDVGIARTQPRYGEQEQATEVERLWLAAIAAARRCIYIEAQYFASRRIGQALLYRLADPGGPEIVVINPPEAHGWLETKAMVMARDHILSALHATDDGARFRVYAPLTAGGRPIYVHSKILIVDDRFVRVGSSNINNRSMGFDTECDLAVEASIDPPCAATLPEAIRDLRDGLIAEHLGCPVADLRRALEETGSVIGAIERLRRRPGRTLRPIRANELGSTEEFLVETQILDPERPLWPLQGLLHRVDWDWLHRRRAARMRRRALPVGEGAGPR